MMPCSLTITRDETQLTKLDRFFESDDEFLWIQASGHPEDVITSRQSHRVVDRASLPVSDTYGSRILLGG